MQIFMFLRWLMREAYISISYVKFLNIHKQKLSTPPSLCPFQAGLFCFSFWYFAVSYSYYCSSQWQVPVPELDDLHWQWKIFLHDFYIFINKYCHLISRYFWQSNIMIVAFLVAYNTLKIVACTIIVYTVCTELLKLKSQVLQPENDAFF